jgi:uncharacterized protein YbjT (DUF2867 family)
MKIALFGASGRTGNLLTERALAAGHTVSALLRRPVEFPFRDRVRVVSGDAFDSRAIAETLEGADVVLSALGARSLGNEGVLERAVPLIVAAMQAHGPRRIVTLGSAGARQAEWVAAFFGGKDRLPDAFEVAGGLAAGAMGSALGQRPGLDDGDAADADQRASDGKVPGGWRRSATEWKQDRARRCSGLHDAADRQPRVGATGRLYRGLGPF